MIFSKFKKKQVQIQKNSNNGLVNKTNGGNGSSNSNLSQADYDRVIDATGEILRIFGEYSFDLNEIDSKEINQLFQDWSRHILIGAPKPSGQIIEDKSSRIKRDWLGMLKFVSKHRQTENKFVNQTVGDFRDVIWSFIHSFSYAIHEDQITDSECLVQLDRLKSVLERNSIQEIKRETYAVVEILNKNIENRKQRQNKEIKSLGEQLILLRDQLNRAKEENSFDPLTKLYNRKSFDDHLSRTFELNMFSGEEACILMVDVDHFKKINDTYGHQAGDSVLRQLADCIIRVFPRKSDFVARYGGEEFCIILRQENLNASKMLANRLLKAVRILCFEHEDIELKLTVSIGIACLQPGDSKEYWLERSDMALYQAKQNGRDRIEIDDHSGVT